MVHIGLKIKELMSERKIDAPTLAKRLKKTKQAVYVMLEKEDISTSVLREVANVFDVSLSYFFEIDGQKEIDELKRRVELLESENERLRKSALLTNNDKALDVSMKFFEAAKEMFTYYNQMKGE
jgi:transcriptional regulator with XRE-family HTH domain